MKTVAYQSLSTKGQMIVDEFKKLESKVRNLEEEKKQSLHKPLAEDTWAKEERRLRNRFNEETKQRRNLNSNSAGYRAQLHVQHQSLSSKNTGFSDRMFGKPSNQLHFDQMNQRDEQRREQQQEEMRKRQFEQELRIAKQNHQTLGSIATRKVFGTPQSFAKESELQSANDQLQRLLKGSHELTFGMQRDIILSYQKIANNKPVEDNFQEPSVPSQHQKTQQQQTANPMLFTDIQRKVEDAQVLANMRMELEGQKESAPEIMTAFTALKMPKEALEASDKLPYYGQALRRAAHGGREEYVDLFLKHGANIDDVDTNPDKHMTALHYALDRKHYDLAIAMIANKNARVDIENAKGITARDFISRLDEGGIKDNILSAVMKKYPSIR